MPYPEQRALPMPRVWMFQHWTLSCSSIHAKARSTLFSRSAGSCVSAPGQANGLCDSAGRCSSGAYRLIRR